MVRPTAAKSRAFRIPLDYYKRDDRLARRKIALSVLALLAALGWWFSAWGRSPFGGDLATHGPIAAVHARWERDCEACHVPFSPIDSRAWNASPNRDASAGNAKCRTCHLGPAHHRNQIPDAAEQGCASCHRDHAGRSADLARTPSVECVACHGDLGKHVAQADFPGRHVVKEPRIDDFAQRHPDFQAVVEKKDPGRLKFNHKLHMTPGLSAGWTLAKLAESDRAAYRSNAVGKSGEIRLECASCHRLQSLSSTAAPGSGAYFRPISFAKDCRACHPTTVAPRGRETAAESDPFEVPHGVQPQKIHEFLWGAFAAEFSAENPKDAASIVPSPSRIPGKNRDRDDKTAKARRTIAGKVLKAERVLFEGKTTCFECHHYDSAAAEAGRLSLDGETYPKFRVVDPRVPEIWLRHARFDHAAHRGVSCAECHQNASADARNASISASDVLIPGIQNCRRCHAPEGRDAQGRTIGGVRFDCVECHRYHDGDHAPSGRGDPARAAEETRTIIDFLSGSSTRSGRSNHP